MNPFDLPWRQMFIPETPVLEIVLRGTIVYLSLFTMLRVVLQRQAGGVGVTDLLVIVLIADAAQNAMAGGYKSITEGLLLVATIILWDFTIDWLGYRFPAVGRFVHPPPLLLVKDGQLQRRNMRRELITEEELMTQLRQQGIEHLADVKKACLEGDGKISAVKKEGDTQPKPKVPVT